APANGAPSQAGPFAVVTLLFFSWGFITVMNDVLLPYLKESFTLTYLQAGLIQFAFFSAFFVVSLIYYAFSRRGVDPIQRLGYKWFIAVALVVCALGCTLFWPASVANSYPFILTALFLLATGVTLLQISANPYAAVLGKPENASARLNLAQGFNSLGTTLAPILGGLLLYKVFASEDEGSLQSVQIQYLIYAGVSLGLAVLVAMSKLPAIEATESAPAPASGALGFPQLRLGMGAIFLYVGAEVAIGSYLVNFLGDPNVMGWPESDANVYLAYYWGGAMIGRLCGAVALSGGLCVKRKAVFMPLIAFVLVALVYVMTGLDFDGGSLVVELAPLQSIAPFPLLVAGCLLVFILGRGSAAWTLFWFSVCLAGMLVVAATAGGRVAMWAAVGAGLFNSIMWSNIFTLSIDGLGEQTPQGSSLLVMMIVGGALFPLLMGAAADAVGVQRAFFVPVLSYAYIAFFGVWSARRIAREGAAA
ncbi:MAG: sugar MFS transporter, partial [Planctomycetota bacterium]